MPDRFDVAIVGAGPAGLALAGAVAARGRTVAVIDPAPDAPWKPVWSGFEDELPGIPVRHRWPRTRVELDAGPRIQERAYVQVDREGLQHQLRAACSTVIRGAVRRWDPRDLGGTLHLDGARPGSEAVFATQIVDCSGATGVMMPHRPAPTAFQTAFGLEITTDGHPWDPQEATWMDLRGLDTPPTFLYAMPFDDRRVFVEETALAWRPALGFDVLEARLHARLERLGVRVVSIEATERCSIPLDLAPHDGLGFGVAGGLVHPATGYLLARVLALAPRFAACLEENPQAARALCAPPQRKLHLLGLETLLRSNGAATSAFFSTFFDQPDWAREAFLSPDPTLMSTIAAMSRIFVTAPASVKWRLAAPLVS